MDDLGNGRQGLGLLEQGIELHVVSLHLEVNQEGLSHQPRHAGPELWQIGRLSAP
jgi:hypothetical protein